MNMPHICYLFKLAIIGIFIPRFLPFFFDPSFLSFVLPLFPTKKLNTLEHPK